MPRKRANTSSPEPDGSESSSPPAKRLRSSPKPKGFSQSAARKQQTYSKVDTVYGMTAAFPGLEDGDSGEMFYGPASDGIEYLRMVRSEAREVPLVLCAPPPPSTTKDLEQAIEEEDPEPEGGYFDDGAFIATAITVEEGSQRFSEAQELYYALLLNRFKRLQDTLRIVPPLEAIERLTSEQPISFPLRMKAARRKWQRVLWDMEPSQTQIACMDAESVQAMVELLGEEIEKLSQRAKKMTVTRFGMWTWAVLGKMRHVSELVSEEVAELRRLGKAAVELLGKKMKSERVDSILNRDIEQDVPHSPDRDEESGLQPYDAEGSNASESLESAKLKLTEMLADDGKVDATEEGLIEGNRQDEVAVCMILDMIITIIGDVYGQRDLLESQPVWRPRSEDSY